MILHEGIRLEMEDETKNESRGKQARHAVKQSVGVEVKSPLDSILLFS